MVLLGLLLGGPLVLQLDRITAIIGFSTPLIAFVFGAANATPGTWTPYDAKSIQCLTYTAAPLILTMATLLGGHWLPPQRLTINSDDYLGYVVSSDDKTLTAFLPGNKAVVRFEAATISRQFCSVSADTDLTYGGRLLGTAELPGCSDGKTKLDLTGPQLPSAITR
ncbi:MAG: hypothetical protein JWO29_644 [Arthrobacter sp.]|nr:hypothetical protein [Arthrobacter sp.]